MNISIELFHYGARFTGYLEENLPHRHDCLQAIWSEANWNALIEGKNIIVEANHTLLISSDTEHQIPNLNLISVLVDTESTYAEDLNKMIEDSTYTIISNKLDILTKTSPLNRQKKSLRIEVRQALELIDLHEHNCDLNEISAKVGLSTERFRKVFKEQVGVSFKAYAKWFKIKTAFKLLLDPKFRHLKIVDIAYQAGFTDHAHMTKTIKETFGHTPKMLNKNL